MLAKIHHRKFLIGPNTCDTSPADLEIFSDNLQGSTKAFIGLILLEDIPDTSLFSEIKHATFSTFADQNRDSQGSHKNSKCADPLFSLLIPSIKNYSLPNFYAERSMEKLLPRQTVD